MTTNESFLIRAFISGCVYVCVRVCMQEKESSCARSLFLCIPFRPKHRELIFDGSEVQDSGLLSFYSQPSQVHDIDPQNGVAYIRLGGRFDYPWIRIQSWIYFVFVHQHWQTFQCRILNWPHSPLFRLCFASSLVLRVQFVRYERGINPKLFHLVFSMYVILLPLKPALVNNRKLCTPKLSWNGILNFVYHNTPWQPVKKKK